MKVSLVRGAPKSSDGRRQAKLTLSIFRLIGRTQLSLNGQTMGCDCDRATDLCHFLTRDTGCALKQINTYPQPLPLPGIGARNCDKMRTPIILLLWLAAYLCVAMKISHRDTTTTRTDLRLPKRLEQCPEQLGAAIYNCTEDACGGQSVDFPGICEDTECPCELRPNIFPTIIR